MDIPVSNLYLPAIAALVGICVLGYMITRSRQGTRKFGLLNLAIIAVLIAIVGAAAVPLFEGASTNAKSSALAQNLSLLRKQIELYKVDHLGRPPVVYGGSLPQLLRSTNAEGVPGPTGERFPYGPYLRGGVPVNPVTGRSVVIAIESFPPESTTGQGGWLYHQGTGQIAPDLPPAASE